MAPVVSQGRNNRQGVAEAISHAWGRSVEKGRRRLLIAGGLVAIFVAILAAGTFSGETVPPATASGTATPAAAAIVSPALRTPAALVVVPAADRLVAVDPALARRRRSRHARASRARPASTPVLRFNLTLNRHADPIKQFVVTLPTGLAFSSSDTRLLHGIAVTAGGKRLKFTAKVSHHKLTIKLRKAARRLRVTFAASAITVSKALAHKLHAGAVKRLRIQVKAAGTRHRTARMTLYPRAL